MGTGEAPRRSPSLAPLPPRRVESPWLLQPRGPMDPTGLPSRHLLTERPTTPAAASAEDLARFTEHEHEVLCRRWRLFAPIVFVLVGLTEVAPLFSPSFPSAMHITGWVLALLAG